MKYPVILAAFFTAALAVPCTSGAQELFVFSEPASNMPAHSLGIRLGNWIMPGARGNGATYQAIPELMWGVNRNLMIHLDGFSSDQGSRFRMTGGGLYAKYRLYSTDAVGEHFRLAAFGRISFNRSPIFQQEIDLLRNNTGFSAGLIATKLLHRQAFSATAGFNRALDNINGAKLPPDFVRNALNFSLSTGRLILPKEYTNFRQTNLNLMLEVLGQQFIGSSRNWIDLAPSVQFIFRSQTRLDLGYKFEVIGNTERTGSNGFMIRIEHLIFNAL